MVVEMEQRRRIDFKDIVDLELLIHVSRETRVAIIIYFTTSGSLYHLFFFFFNFPIISNLVVAWQRRKILCWSAWHLTLSLRSISLEIPSPEWASASVSSRWRRSTRYPLDPFQVWLTIVKAILLLHS